MEEYNNILSRYDAVAKQAGNFGIDAKRWYTVFDLKCQIALALGADVQDVKDCLSVYDVDYLIYKSYGGELSKLDLMSDYDVLVATIGVLDSGIDPSLIDSEFIAEVTLVDLLVEPVTAEPMWVRVDGTMYYEDYDKPEDFNMEYSLDKKKWMPFEADEEIEVEDAVVYLRGLNPNGLNIDDGNVMTLQGDITEVGGDIRSLIGGTKFTNVKDCPNYCFVALFSDIVTLSDASKLLIPFDTVGEFAFYQTFVGCTRLEHAPVTLEVGAWSGDGCCREMFGGCSRLLDAPALPTMELTRSCYAYMFSGCSSLVGVPELPATTLSIYCYDHMFDGCSSLTQGTVLPASQLVGYCYQAMYQRCTSMTDGGVIMAENATSSAMLTMFQKCNKLQRVTYYGRKSPSFRNWLFDVNPTGTFVAPNVQSWPSDPVTYSETSVPEGWIIQANLEDLDYDYLYVATEDNEVGYEWTTYSTVAPYVINMDYSIDGDEWTSLEAGTSVTVPNHTKVYLRGDNTYISSSNATNVVSTTHVMSINTNHLVGGIYTTGGRPYSLLKVRDNVTSSNQRAFWGLFYNCKTLRDASRLDLLRKGAGTSLPTYEYGAMFAGCEALTLAPALPNLTLSNYCYTLMFADSGLVECPVLPATTLAQNCYDRMFHNCRSISEGSEIMASTVVTRAFFQMYQYSSVVRCGKTHFTSSTVLATYTFQGMFQYSDLEESPYFLTVQFANYPQGCFTEMMRGCKNLHKIVLADGLFSKIVNATTSSTSFTSNWLSGGDVMGVIVAPEYNMNTMCLTTRNQNTVPQNWKITNNENDPALMPYVKISPRYGDDYMFGLNRNVSGVEYSLDGTNWSNLVYGSEVSVLGNDLYIRSSAKQNLGDADGSTVFTLRGVYIDGYFELSGNLMALYDYKNMLSQSLSLSSTNTALSGLFRNNTEIVSLSNLCCFSRYIPYMCSAFKGCSNIVDGMQSIIGMTFSRTYALEDMFANCDALERGGLIAYQSASNWQTGALVGTFMNDINLNQLAVGGRSITYSDALMSGFVDETALASDFYLYPGSTGPELYSGWQTLSAV